MAPASRVRMVKGPARVVVNGACRVLGSDVSDSVISVRPGKALPFEPANRCRLRIRLGHRGRTWTARPEFAGVSMWQDVARKITALADEKRRPIAIMLAGDTDTGKSTLCAFLANMTLSSGRVPCVIDGDIGQGDLAPPAAIGAATLHRQVTDLRDARANLFEFVGDISPAGLEHIIARKLRTILDKAQIAGTDADIFIINTDGYVADGGAAYKEMTANELLPDAIVCLGENAELFYALASGPWPVLQARSSTQTYKSRVERIDRRLDQFLRFVGNGSTVADLAEIKFVYSNRIFAASELKQPPPPPIPQLWPENMKSMFVGLGSEKEVVGFGIIKAITDDDRMCIQTDVDSFTNVYLSNIRLGRNNTEIKINQTLGL